MPIATASPWRSSCAVSELELVRGPVAEVERARAAQLERIAAGRDVREVELGAAPDQLLDRVELERGELRGARLEPVEERGVADQRDLDRLGHAGDAIARRERREEARVVDRPRTAARTCRGSSSRRSALTPFFTPTPASFCASTVVGTRTRRTPRCTVAAA